MGKRHSQWGSGILSACEKMTPWTAKEWGSGILSASEKKATPRTAKEWGSGILSAYQKKSSVGLIPIATKRTSRFAAIIQRSTEPFLI